MKWTTPADIRAQVQKLWDRGVLQAMLAGGEPLFPRRLILKGPSSREIAQRFAEVRDWINELDRDPKRYRLNWRTVNHRILGTNSLPAEIWIDSLEDALALIGRQREAERFAELIEVTADSRPQLIPWLAKRPSRALELAETWPRLLAVVAWLQHHPRPGIYLRQVDIPGVHSKFIETHRSVLSELLDLALPPETIDRTAGGLAGFCRRYGFRDKPARIRFRLLDPSLAVVAGDTDQDFTITADSFARLTLPIEQVFITENEINFLAFPPVASSMVIFGAGYGFDLLAQASWLHDCRISYWGDIDSHGFAILDQLRAHFPNVISFLMDRATLLAHRSHWDQEPQPETRELPRLTNEERRLYDDLRADRLAYHLRLEQERIGFEWVRKWLRES